ncbi:MAG: asparagine--tRNA ligase, partial [Verrucomicrobiales bacterium]
MTKLTVKEALGSEGPHDGVLVQGWVRTRRDSKAFSFLEINDGSCLKSVQVIADAGIEGYREAVLQATTGASLVVEGNLVESQGKGQSWEVVASKVTMLGASDDSYPLQKKGHSAEFLRSIAHLRPRSNLFGCVFRVRSRMAYAIHTFFQERGFVHVHTPIITASDCEGAGEMFAVSAEGLPMEEEDEAVAAGGRHFFGKPAYLTVSGQLAAETFACALSNVYTFGPTFRAENSHTSRHASEFWMVEPEMAFCDLEADMSLAEEMVKYLVVDALEHNAEDLELFGKFVDKGLLERLHFIVERDFQRVSYSEVVEILEQSGKKFDYPVGWGVNLQSEHERFLTEEHFKC